MPSPRRFLIYIGGAAIFLLILNMTTWFRYYGDNLELSRAKLRQKIDLLSAKAQFQAKLEVELQRDISSIHADLKQDLKTLPKTPTAVKASKVVAVGPDFTPVPEVIAANPAAGHVVTPVPKAIAAIPAVSAAYQSVTDGLVIPVLVFACNRATAVARALDDLIKYRPSKEKFPIIVTQDCGHEETRLAIQKYKDVILKHIMQPDLSAIPNLTKKEKKLEGYMKISRHYKWAMGQVFDEMKYTVAIIMEDDLNIAPDFFEYFEATYSLLKEDPTLYCVSAWNDNGKASHIEDNPELLYRSDFFPGLGWMLLNTVWNEYRDTWPQGFWDDWIRMDSQRHGRACIRPEISRTHTFGDKGVSLGMFYKTHLKFMVLNEKMVRWTQMDLSYLTKDVYDTRFISDVNSCKVIGLNEVEQVAQQKTYSAVRVIYTTKNSFKVIAKALDLMSDFKDGIPRTAYRGVLTIMHKGLRIYLTPPSDWTKYDTSWT